MLDDPAAPVLWCPVMPGETRPDTAAWKWPVMWGVVEEHLDEAAFLHGQWESARVAAHYVAAEVIEGPEERLLAHLDGLAVAGPVAMERLLVPALTEPDSDRIFSAAWALSAIDGGLPVLLEALDWSDPVTRGAAARALELSLAPGLDGALVRHLNEDEPGERQAALLQVLAFRRWPIEEALLQSVDLENPEIQRAVMRARWTRDGASRQVLEAALASNDPTTRDAAIAHGLALRMRAAWEACREVAASPNPEAASAWLLHALVGGEESLAPVEAALGGEATRRAALWALGFSGWPRAAEVLLPYLEDPPVARVAGEAFSAITGAALEGEMSRPSQPLPGEESEGGGEAEEETPEIDLAEEHLPVPEPEAVAAWWAKNRRRFDPHRRYLGGRPLTAKVLAEALEQGSMRRRAELALELRLRTEGQVNVETGTWVRAQERFQPGARAAEHLDFQEPLARHLVR